MLHGKGLDAVLRIVLQKGLDRHTAVGIFDDLGTARELHRSIDRNLDAGGQNVVGHDGSVNDCHQ